MAWGTAKSHNLISWEVNNKPVLSPDNIYNSKGVFTGYFVKAQDGTLSYIYTSINTLPVHHTVLHQRGCETLSIATSADRGKTWYKCERNYILSGEPSSLDVTGWGDPFCAPWPNISKTLGLDPTESIFSIILGGIRDMTPTSFLYKVNPKSLGDWEYIGHLVNFGVNLRPSRWSGDPGKNWEVTNLLHDENDSYSRSAILIMGTEGCLEDSPEESPGRGYPSRQSRGQL